MNVYARAEFCVPLAALAVSVSIGCSSAASTGAGGNDAAATDSTAPIDGGSTLDVVADAGAAADAACLPLPGCDSRASCPAGDGCDVCGCYLARWYCAFMLTDMGSTCTEAGAFGSPDAGVCPWQQPYPRLPCNGRSDVVCAYCNGTDCPACSCQGGTWSCS